MHDWQSKRTIKVKLYQGNIVWRCGMLQEPHIRSLVPTIEMKSKHGLAFDDNKIVRGANAKRYFNLLNLEVIQPWTDV